MRRDLKRERPGDAYGTLLRSIVGQQLSTKAARDDLRAHARAVRRARADAQAAARRPTPRRSAPPACRAPRSPTCATWPQHVEDGTLELERLPDLPDEEVAAQLTAIKGLGQWTADMFLMFHLGRPDILPVGDQGIRRAIQVEYRLRKLPDAKRMREDRPALAPLPHARLPLPLELAGQHAGLIAALCARFAGPAAADQRRLFEAGHAMRAHREDLRVASRARVNAARLGYQTAITSS